LLDALVWVCAIVTALLVLLSVVSCGGGYPDPADASERREAACGFAIAFAERVPELKVLADACSTELGKQTIDAIIAELERAARAR